MGTQELDWVTVANHLLSRCHIELRVRDVTHCDARIFLALYQAILGENVPDCIAEPRSQEDDAHNVQSVIDSLALDYLQVSLSHITGENIVRGDVESIGNLLEIFDGLLEYLTEQISEASSQDGDDAKDVQDQHDGQKEELPVPRPPPSPGSSELLPPSWEADGSESTNELIRLGETAHTFIQRGLNTEGWRQREEQKIIPKAGAKAAPITSVPSPPVIPAPKELSVQRGLSMNGLSLHEESQEVTPSAIPLRRPYQPKDSRPTTISQDSQLPESSDRATGNPVRNGRPTSTARGSTGGSRSSPQESSHLTSPESRTMKHGGLGPSPEVSSQSIQKKVAFRTQPDIRFMTLQRTLEDQDDWTAPSDGVESDPDPAHSSGFSLLHSRTSGLSLADEPLSVQRARNKLSEMQLQEMSDKLSQRLDKLDEMLKKALGEQIQSAEPKDEDKLSQHSDSIMEFRRKKRLQGAARHRAMPMSRPRSLTSSPLPCAQFEDALNKEAGGDLGKIRREVQKELDLQRLRAQMLNSAYKEELKDFEKNEKVKLSQLKEELKQKEQEHKENIFTEPEKKWHPEKVYSGKQTRPAPRARQWAPSCHRATARMKIKENELLPLLLEEFPHLQISRPTFNALWKGQLAQVEQLTRSAQEDERSERKLHREVEEAQKRHDLLTEILRRERGHSQRLRDFRDRVRLQKSSHNQMKERRQQAARAKKYYEDHHVQLRAKLMRARTQEERMLKKVFAEGLEIQKQRLRDIRSYSREQHEEQRKRHKDELDSMENYYKDQFSMLAEAVSQERQEVRAHEKAQTMTLQKMKKELRVKMEKEIRELQVMIVAADEDAFFRELEAERLKRRLNMASFQYGQSHCL